MAFFTAWGIDPDMTREGGSIPVTLTLQELTKKNVMLLPIGSCDDMAHSQNEKLNVKNYIQGVLFLPIFHVFLFSRSDLLRYLGKVAWRLFLRSGRFTLICDI